MSTVATASTPVKSFDMVDFARQVIGFGMHARSLTPQVNVAIIPQDEATIICGLRERRRTAARTAAQNAMHEALTDAQRHSITITPDAADGLAVIVINAYVDALREGM